MRNINVMENRKYLKIDGFAFKDTFRFYIKIKLPSDLKDCWEWTGTKQRGYGIFYIKCKPIIATRISYFVFTGTDPGDLQVCHTCDNPCCVNPNHLFLGTISDNMKDKVKKGRGATGENINTCKITKDIVEKIRAKNKSKWPIVKIAETYGISPQQVYNICSYKSWKNSKHDGKH